jgi:hypothetical protein
MPRTEPPATVLQPRTLPPPALDATVVQPSPVPSAVVPSRRQPWGWLGAAAVVLVALLGWRLVLRPAAEPVEVVLAPPAPAASVAEPEPAASLPSVVPVIAVMASAPEPVEVVAPPPLRAAAVAKPMAAPAVRPAASRPQPRPAAVAETPVAVPHNEHPRAAAAETPAAEAARPSGGVCADRSAIARFICLQTECYKTANREQPACVAFTRAERERQEQQGLR